MLRRREDPCEQPGLAEGWALEDLLRKNPEWIAAQLWNRYRIRLRSHDFEDIVAVARSRAWQSREHFDAAKGESEAWFLRICANAARDDVRAKRRRPETIFDPWRLAAMPDPRAELRDDESDSTNGWPNWEQLIATIAALPEAYRLILLSDAASPSGKADDGSLAKELGISRSSVRVYRMRARAEARQCLEHAQRFQDPQ